MRAVMERRARWMLARAKQQVRNNPRLRSLVYDSENQGLFANLYNHELMLADRVRVDAYHAAISRAVTPESVVLDLGTGTGVLAMFAAKAGARKVYAVEHGPVVDVARRLAAENGLTNIEFVAANGRDFTPPEPIDLIIHEQIGHYLFDENMVENLLDLKARMLAPTGRILPARFEIYLEPIRMQAAHRVPYLWEQELHGIEFSSQKSGPSAEATTGISASRAVPTGSLERFACAPAPIGVVDLDTIESEAAVPLTMRATKTIVGDGVVDGLSLFFRVIFDDDLSFDNSIDSPHLHWNHPVYRLPEQQVSNGETIDINLHMGELRNHRSWSVDFERHTAS